MCGLGEWNERKWKISPKPVIMSASSLLVADMGLQAGAAVVLVGGFRERKHLTWGGWAG